MREEEYRKAEGHNWSTIKEMEKSPLAYKMACQFPVEQNDHMRLGSFIDCALLTPELLEDRYIIIPEITGWRGRDEKEAVVNNYASLLSQAGVEAEEIESLINLKRGEFEDYVRRALTHTGKIPIPEKGDVFAYEKAIKIVEANIKKPALMRALEATERIQAALFAECEVTGLKLKSLLDLITGSSITDLKTIGSLGKVWYNMKAYNYPGQLSFYDYVAKLNGIVKQRHYLYFIQTTFPYPAKVIEIDQGWIDAKREKFIPWLQQIKQCEERGEWPDGSDEVEFYEYRESDNGPTSELESLERMEEPGQDQL